MTAVSLALLALTAGPTGAVEARMGNLGKTRGGCHKPFRKPKR